MNDINSIGNARLIIREVSKVIVGKDESLIKVLLAIIAGGHILMEDIPGVGKTTMAISISKALGLEYGRVQFTPDVLPSDITGYSIFDKESGKMTYQKGAVLCNLFLADELNRATSRTQSALLQAMEEGMVTVDNHTYPVPQPFIVIATQNPTGAKGTQMLPDSQMDRFMLRLSMGYPAHDDEIEMIRRKQKGITIDAVQQVVSRDDLLRIRREAEQVYIKDDVIDYIVRLCEATRNDGRIVQGASPRASLALTSLSKATAWIQGRDYVLPKDIRFVFFECIEHRLIWSQEMPDAESKRAALAELFSTVEAPSLK
ncbi:MAG: MoxR family ATPase [Firmicutes bacterium]|jgi:MoxR-like ATPase|nr:MoxR family ATPase [Bacillota bacterium]